MEYNELDIALMSHAELHDAFMKSANGLYTARQVEGALFAEMILRIKPSYVAYLRDHSPGFDWNSRVGIGGRLLGMPMIEGPAGMLRSKWAPVRGKFVPEEVSNGVQG